MRWQRMHLIALFLLLWLFVMLNETRRARRQGEIAVPGMRLTANV
jgi:hypothetical protein